MQKKDIQEQRMKGYFIQATKELLKGEGLRTVSVRNIADRAGYSYATLYNYFKDVKDLIFFCVQDFQEECELQVKSDTRDSPRGIEKLKNIIRSYIKYFVQYPGIFELFFLEKISDIGYKQPVIELIYTFLDLLGKEEWDFLVSQGMISAGEAEIMREEVRFLITGLLLFYLNRRRPAYYREFMEITERQLGRIFEPITIKVSR